MTFRFIFPHNVVAHYYKRNPLYLCTFLLFMAKLQKFTQKQNCMGPEISFVIIFCHFDNFLKKKYFVRNSIFKNHQKMNSSLQNHQKSTKLPTL